MNPLTARRRRNVADEQVRVLIARQMGNMELATRVTQAKTYGIVMVHHEASTMVAQTIAAAGQVVRAAAYAGRITPAKESKLRRRTQKYLNEMLDIAHDTDGEILDIFSRW